jgi:hypothetical protein
MTITIDEMNDSDNRNPPPLFFEGETFFGNTIAIFVHLPTVSN